MDIQVKSSNGITLVPLETRLLTNRQIFLEGEIDSKSYPYSNVVLWASL